MSNYIQSTYETCLVCCLLAEITQINKDIELDCIIHSLKFSKKDFVGGHLDFIEKNFNKKLIRIVDNKFYFENYVEKSTSDLSPVQINKINLNLINKFIEKSRIIIYLDNYFLHKEVHFPHFVTILKKADNSYLIYDPWDGNEKVIEGKILSKAISSLRNNLKFCPQMIIL